TTPGPKCMDRRPAAGLCGRILSAARGAPSTGHLSRRRRSVQLPQWLMQKERSRRLAEAAFIEPDLRFRPDVGHDPDDDRDAEFIAASLGETDQLFCVVRLAVVRTDEIPEFFQVEVARIPDVRYQQVDRSFQLPRFADHADDGALLLEGAADDFLHAR